MLPTLPRLRRALFLAAVLVTGGAAAASAVTASDTWTVPSQATITIDGHGFGHGHGMSQYGAEGAARGGMTYQQIVEFYYPGTTWGTAGGRVSVLISADTTDDLVVLARPGLAVKDTAVAGKVTLPDNGATRWRLSVDSTGKDQVSYLTDAWHPFATLTGQGVFSAAGAPITLVTPTGNVAYRGRLASRAPSAGSLARDTVNVLTLEAYLQGVVPREIPSSWQAEALRAQAVAARTYALYGRAHPRAPHYQLCDTTLCQVYGGYTAERPSTNAAVVATRGQLLLASGTPAFTQFGSSSGGWTAAGSVPYLSAQQDPYDGWDGNPMHLWSVQVTDARIEKLWPGIGDLRQITVTKRDGNGDWGGRVVSLTLQGSAGQVVVSGNTFRTTLGLRSTWLTFRVG